MGYDFVFSTWAFSTYASWILGIAESMCWTLLVNAVIVILTIWMLDLISSGVHLCISFSSTCAGARCLSCAWSTSLLGTVRCASLTPLLMMARMMRSTVLVVA